MSDGRLTRRIFGLDFSGAKEAGRSIWLCEGRSTAAGFQVKSCRPAAELPGSGIDRARSLAALRDFIAGNPDAIFGCDFPFGLPRELITAASWGDFLAGFDHADADGFREHCRRRSHGREPRRATDRVSRTPWCAFNIRLYRQSFYGISGLLRPLVTLQKAAVLPMQRPRRDRAWMIETCPASTLKHLRWRGSYKGAALGSQRRAILALLREKCGLLALAPALEERVLENAGGDALDSIIAALATAAALAQIDSGEGCGDPLEGCVYFRI